MRAFFSIWLTLFVFSLAGCSLDLDALRGGRDGGAADGGDAGCPEVAECAGGAGSHCEGDSLVECAPDETGCLVLQTTDCAATSTLCHEESGAASCVDPCSLITTCEAPASCDGRDLVTCTEDEHACLVDPQSMECPWYCGDASGVAQCVDNACPYFARDTEPLDCASGTVQLREIQGGTAPFCDGVVPIVFAMVPFRSAERSVVTIDAITPATAGSQAAVDLRDGRQGDCTSAHECREGFESLDDLAGAPLVREFIAEAGVPYYLTWGVVGGPNDYPTLSISCTPIVCGNSVIETSPGGFGETCDDGNTADGDGCSSGCLRDLGWRCEGAPSDCERVCGNGTLDADASEICDDGGRADGDGCSADCQQEQGYVCTTADGPSSCTRVCGNGTIEPEGGEQCDDGGEAGGDGCSADCILEEGYICTGVPSACVLACGNGVIDAVQREECDDGNANDGDGCSSECAREPYYVCTGTPSVCEIACGNGTRNYLPEISESCDDGGTAGGDGCSSECQSELNYVCTGTPDVCTFSCGNGALNSYDAGETCDDGGRSDGNGCSQDCSLEPGYLCSGATCTRVCGNGTRDLGTSPPEQCDDGNGADGDGCSSSCRIERGYACVEGTDCNTTRCGNLILDGNEECDDGNPDDSDGCLSDCTMQVGYYCAGVPSTCAVTTCGDGTVDDGEACDDGNRAASDGCSPRCAIELGAPGTSVDVSGMLEGSDPTYARQNADCVPSSGAANFHYRQYVFENTSPSRLMVSFMATWGADGYLHVYEYPFVPEAPVARCIDGNDDFTGTGRSYIPAMPIDPGERIVVVASTYSGGVTMDHFTIEVRTH